jgi:hypothetical protein
MVPALRGGCGCRLSRRLPTRRIKVNAHRWRHALPRFNLQSVVSLEKGREFQDFTSETFRDKWLVLFYWPMDFTFVVNAAAVALEV